MEFEIITPVGDETVYCDGEDPLHRVLSKALEAIGRGMGGSTSYQLVREDGTPLSLDSTVDESPIDDGETLWLDGNPVDI